MAGPFLFLVKFSYLYYYQKLSTPHYNGIFVIVFIIFLTYTFFFEIILFIKILCRGRFEALTSKVRELQPQFLQCSIKEERSMLPIPFPLKFGCTAILVICPSSTIVQTPAKPITLLFSLATRYLARGIRKFLFKGFFAPRFL